MRIVPCIALVVGLSTALAPLARAELVVSPVRQWGVESSQREGFVVQYLACNAAGAACVAVGVGDATDLGGPISVDHRAFPNGTLRARYCRPTATGGASSTCGPLSEPGPAFLLASALVPTLVYSIPAGGDWTASNTALSYGIHRMVLPLPGSVPVSAALRLWFLDAPGPTVQVSLIAGATLLATYDCAPCSGPVGISVRDALREALRAGAREIDVRIAWTGRPGRVGTALPGSGAAELPHLRLTLWPREPYDLDGDGVLDDGDRTRIPGDAPCEPGEWLTCDDNCPTAPNPGQADADADGFGDSCDPNGDPARSSVGGPLDPASPTDCMLEWRYAREEPPLDESGVVSSTPSCRDGDPSCDLDSVPGQCTLGLGVCLNVRDPRLPTCSSSEVNRVTFFVTGSTGANLSAISAAVPPLPERDADSCGPFAVLVVPAGSTLGVAGYARGYTATSSTVDNDAVALDCLR